MENTDRRNYAVEQKIIEDAIDLALSKRQFPCQAQDEQLEQMRLAIEKLSVIMTGNGNPQNGFIYRFSLVESKMNDIVKERWFLYSAAVGLIIIAIGELLLK